MVEPGSKRIGLGITLALVVGGCLLQILLVPHEVEGVNSANVGKPPELSEAIPPQMALTIVPPSQRMARASSPAVPENHGIVSEPAPEDDLWDQEAPAQPRSVLEVMGPPEAVVGDLVTFSIVLQDAHDAVYAPLVLSHDPEILGFVSAEEGNLFSFDGAETQFVAAPSSVSGQLEISISRVPPASGLERGGVLASATFLVLADGESRIGIEGSRLVDPIGREIGFNLQDTTLLARGSGSGIEGDLE